MAVNITVVNNENINISIESGGSTGFNPASSQYITGSWSFDLSQGQNQLLMTDDPTLQAHTYLFCVYNDTQSGYIYDYRIIHLPTSTGFHSYRDNNTGDAVVISSATDALVVAAYDSVTTTSTAKTVANNKGFVASYNGTSVSATITTDTPLTVNGQSAVTMGDDELIVINDIDLFPFFTTAFKRVRALYIYGYIKTKAALAGLIPIAKDTYANIVAGYGAEYLDCEATATDVGIHSSTLIRTSTGWRMKHGKGMLYKNTKIVILPPTATISTGTSGQFVSGSNLPSYVQNLNYVMVYLTAVGSLTAGFYPIVFSSQTTGTIYTDTTLTTPLDVTSGGTCTGTSAGTAIAVDSFNLPGGLFKNWSQLCIRVRVRSSLSTNSKTVAITQTNSVPQSALKGTIAFSGGGVTGYTADFDLIALNDNLSIGAASAHQGLGIMVNHPSSTTVLNLSNDSTMNITLEKATATEYLMLEFGRAELIQ